VGLERLGQLKNPVTSLGLEPATFRLVASQVRPYGICGGQCGTGAGFLRLLRFPLPILTPPTAPHSSPSIIGAGRVGQLAVGVPSGLSHTAPQYVQCITMQINTETEILKIF
jgi:hypothetical protein